jgi:hypothetical protein
MRRLRTPRRPSVGDLAGRGALGPLKRRCKQLLDQLNLPGQLDPESLIAHLEPLVGRPIKLVGIRLPADGASGLWLATTSTNYVFYDSVTAGAHRALIILHELAHIVLDHQHSDGVSTPAGLLPDLDAALIERSLGRTCFDVDAEAEAEMFASMLQERMTNWTPDITLEVPPEAQALVARFSRTMERRR